MTGRFGTTLMLLAALVGSAPAASATEATPCPNPASVLREHGGLPFGRQAVAGGEPLRIVLIGTQGSVRAGRVEQEPGYADHVASAIRLAAPNLSVAVTVHAATGRTTQEMAGEIPALMTAVRPHLVVWQTGTVDAMRGVDLDGFSSALDSGIAAATAGKADLVLVNLAYVGPRMLRMPNDYVKYMLWSAQSGGAPLVDRYGLMRAMADGGTVDLRTTTDEARRAVTQAVNRCLAAVIGRFVAAEVTTPP